MVARVAAADRPGLCRRPVPRRTICRPGLRAWMNLSTAGPCWLGLQHPLTGWDHCLALMAIGWRGRALAARRGSACRRCSSCSLVLGGCMGTAGGGDAAGSVVLLPWRSRWRGAVALRNRAMTLLLAVDDWCVWIVPGRVPCGAGGSRHASQAMAGYVMASLALMFAAHALVACWRRRLLRVAMPARGAGAHRRSDLALRVP